MRKFTFSLPSNLLILALFALNFFFFESYAQVGIGTTSPQAMLDVVDSDPDNPNAKDGFLMPRVTSLPTGDIAEGMLIYYCSGCTDTDGDGQVNYENGSYYVYVDNDGNGTSEWTELASNSGVVEVDNTSPTAPTNLAASNPSTTTIDLSWTVSTDNVGVAGYFIYLNDGTLVTTAPSNSITVTGLEANTSYTFYVTAYDASMNESTSSNKASETTQSGCVASTICETSFEGTNGCWTLFTYNGSNDINNTSSPGCSYSAYNGSNVIEIQQDGGVRTSSNDFTGNTSVDVSFYHTGYNKPNSHSCSGAITNTVYLEVSTNGISWTVIESYSSSSTWQQATGTIDGVYMTSGIYIRIRVDGDSNKDYTLLDSTRIDVNCD